MKTASVSKPKQAKRVAGSILPRRDDVMRRAATIRSHWSDRERRERAGLADQLQCWLVASVISAAYPSPALAYVPVR